MKEINTKYKRSPWSLVLGVFALSLAACGGDSSTSSTGSSECTNTYGINTVTDCRDGQTYATVVIGTQTWMAENLNYAVDSSWCYDNNADSCAKYGRLYQWAAAMALDAAYNSITWGGSDVNHQGECPSGWHVPSDAEWTTLENFVGGPSTAGTALKSMNDWYDDGNGADAYGFSALPAGYRYRSGGFNRAGECAYFWSATGSGMVDASRRVLCHDLAVIRTLIASDEDGAFSVRCVKD
ncbi:MAG: fibrobacter succinogenes major paralogous domain-containing protein [Fibrobacteraceae bacterium]|nr:fibrobacter succinogenes major paralogous domain-containing protein [Fibrobacteraceae bacterium]